MKLEDILSKSHIDLAVNTLSEDEPQLLAPVKNTFLHFDNAPCAPAELLRLHTCPAEVGMSYFFERIGKSPGRAVSSTACVAPESFKMLERSCSAAKSVSWAPTEPSLEEEVKSAEEKKEPEEEKEPKAAAELGEFFTVKKGKKGKKARLAPPKQGSTAAAVEEPAAVVEAAEQQPAPLTEPAAVEDNERSSSEVLASVALDNPRSATEEKSQPHRADLEETNKEESASVMTKPTNEEETNKVEARSRPRWVDLESDDEEATTRPVVPAAAKPAPAAPRGRPAFSKPNREARVRQARADVAEICALEFDTVDASSQSGLVGRMLVMLKSLAQQVVFWEKAAEEAGGAEEKREEEKFRLLGLEEDDMYAIGRHIRKADKKIDDRQFREAFNEMCEARRWLQDDPEWIEAQRARRAEKATREPKEKETRRVKKTEVKEEQAAPMEADDEDDEWQTVGGGAAEKKKRKAPEKAVTSCATPARTPARAAGTNGRPTRGAAAERQQQQPPAPAPAPQQPARQAAAAPSRPAGERRYPAAGSSSAAAPAMPQREGTKFLCRFAVGIEAEVKGNFRVCRRIFGPGGENMKSIARETNAKLRLRGRGSGFKEGPELREADEPLVLCVSAEDLAGYWKAVQSVSALFERIYEDYRAHCEKHRLPLDPELTIRLQEHPGNPRS